MKAPESPPIALSGLSTEEKFGQMLERLKNDPEYPTEYDTFVKGVSYAAEGECPDFTTALQAVRQLVRISCSALR